MKLLIPIVEGHGEVQALPVLLRRILQQDSVAGGQISVGRPIRQDRHKIVKAGELEHAIQYAALKQCDAILVILDADDDCPAELGPQLLARAHQARPDIPIWVVIAKSEFETWFIGGIESLRGARGITSDALPPEKPEAIRGAKEWLSQRMPAAHPYLEIDDQPALAARLDLDQARVRCPSFDKFLRDIEEMVWVLTGRTVGD
jgi:hypothetical protein